jgi:hypothetical protein
MLSTYDQVKEILMRKVLAIATTALLASSAMAHPAPHIPQEFRGQWCASDHNSGAVGAPAFYHRVGRTGCDMPILAVRSTELESIGVSWCELRRIKHVADKHGYSMRFVCREGDFPATTEWYLMSINDAGELVLQ